MISNSAIFTQPAYREWDRLVRGGLAKQRMVVRTIPTEQEILGWYTSLSNWGRWGPDDERGTLNLITPEKRIQAAGLVREGHTVSVAHPVNTTGDAENT